MQLLPLAPTPWLVLGIELLQGATFALGWTAGCVYVKRTAPRHARSTTQVSSSWCDPGWQRPPLTRASITTCMNLLSESSRFGPTLVKPVLTADCCLRGEPILQA